VPPLLSAPSFPCYMKSEPPLEIPPFLVLRMNTYQWKTCGPFFVSRRTTATHCPSRSILQETVRKAVFRSPSFIPVPLQKVVVLMVRYLFGCPPRITTFSMFLPSFRWSQMFPQRLAQLFPRPADLAAGNFCPFYTFFPLRKTTPSPSSACRRPSIVNSSQGHSPPQPLCLRCIF